MARHHHIYHARLGYLGKLKIVTGKTFKGGGISGRSEQLHFARLPQTMRDLNPGQLYNSLDEHFAESCTCAHDCCGCYFGGIVDIYTKGRYITIRTHYQRNI